MTNYPPSVPSDIHALRQQQIEDEILALLSASPSTGAGTIERTLGGYSRNSIKQALCRLLHKKAITRTGTGLAKNPYRYSIADQVELSTNLAKS